MIQPFQVHIGQDVLDDLKIRIRNTRWPDQIKNSGWTYGADLHYIRELAEYWLNRFDWRLTEQQINAYDNYMATIDGYHIHFVHVKGKSKNPMPLIITHGWPSSFLEMFRLIPLLTKGNEFSFDLVIPSMMGYGFSQRIEEPGCNVGFMADLWHKLMLELGYTKFGLQGGDFGAGISSMLAKRYPDNVTGLHLNYIPGNYHPELKENDVFTKEEELYLKAEDDWYSREGGYSMQQGTRPLTLAYGLNDSPIGLCSWIVEKMYGWAESNGNIENVFTKDELLSNVTLYWVTQTLHSSIRLYNENRKLMLKLGQKDFIKTPVGIARFRFEDPFPPRKYIERGFNIQHWTDFPSGGHFPAIERPEWLAGDILQFFRNLQI